MAVVDGVGEAIRLSFEAKKRQYQDCPDFHLSQAGPLTRLHGVPSWHEVDAFYARDLPPLEVVAAVRSARPHSRHMITLLANEAPTAAVTEEFACLGYQPLPEPPQPLMSKPLLVGSAAVSAHEIRQGQEGPDVFSCSIVCEGEVACSGKYVWASSRTIYIFAMQTQRQHRRQGMARALLDRIHADAVREGGEQSILWSSPTGLFLYHNCGYSPVVTGYSFIPAD